MTKIRFYDFEARFERVKFTLLLRDYGNTSMLKAKCLMEELIDEGEIVVVLSNTSKKDTFLSQAREYGVFGETLT